MEKYCTCGNHADYENGLCERCDETAYNKKHPDYDGHDFNRFNNFGDV